MKSRYLNKLGQYFFYALLAVSVVLTVIFYLHTGNANQSESTAKQMADIGSSLDNLFYWTYLMTLLAVLLAIGLPMVSIVGNPKKGIKVVLSFVLIAVLVIVAYQFTNGTPMNIAGYEGPDNIPSRLKLVETAIFSMYAMVVVSVIAVLFGEIRKLIK
jgi:hypothetical protein